MTHCRAGPIRQCQKCHSLSRARSSHSTVEPLRNPKNSKDRSAAQARLTHPGLPWSSDLNTDVHPPGSSCWNNQNNRGNPRTTCLTSPVPRHVGPLGTDNLFRRRPCRAGRACPTRSARATTIGPEGRQVCRWILSAQFCPQRLFSFTTFRQKERHRYEMLCREMTCFTIMIIICIYDDMHSRKASTWLWLSICNSCIPKEFTRQLTASVSMMRPGAVNDTM